MLLLHLGQRQGYTAHNDNIPIFITTVILVDIDLARSVLHRGTRIWMVAALFCIAGVPKAYKIF